MRRRRKRKKRRAPVQVDVPVEDVDGDVAQGENHSGMEMTSQFLEL